MASTHVNDVNHDLVKFAYENLNHVPQGLVEYEKMILGLAYDSGLEILVRKRVIAHEEALDYGGIRLKQYGFDLDKYSKARQLHLAKIFGQISNDVFIEAPFYVDYGFNVVLGKGFYANFNCTFLDCSLIVFGNYCLLGPNVTFCTPTHPGDPETRQTGQESAEPIFVGDNVWFGANSVVLKGVTIGANSIVGAGAVVTKDVPANCVVVGSPAKVVKYLTLVKEKDQAKSILS